MADAAIKAESANENKEKYSGQIDRGTDELVIGLVGAVGAGVSYSAKIIKEILEKEYGYEVSILKSSEFIKSNKDKVDHKNPSESGAERIQDLQEIGNKLRRVFGDDYIAAKAIENIAISREKEKGYDKSKEVPQPISMRKLTIIDSLKHQKETDLFRRVYGGIYWQFTIFAPEKLRETRLKNQNIDKESLAGIFSKDENSAEDHGQKVSKTAALSDFFVRNDKENDVRLRVVISRFLEIMFATSVHTPTSDEAGMFSAASAANKSACLSRQVGAAVYSKTNELLAVGWNDVPKHKGGLYISDDKESDHRCYKWAGKICHNDDKKNQLYDKIYKSLGSLIKENTSFEEIKLALKKTPLKDLIEYSRAIHAEMEAIVSVARAGKAGMVDGILYTTTYPCHNCARHIVAAGLKTVYYIEPYAKSLAIDLHSDAISDLEDDSKVSFLQYEGVGPESMIKLFQNGKGRKHEGRATTNEKHEATPVFPPPMDGFSTHEKRVIEMIQNKESA